jgi:hypothetical protein
MEDKRMGDDDQQAPAKPPKRSIPQSDLDFSMQLTNPAWGKEELGAGARETFIKTFLKLDPKTRKLLLDAEGHPEVDHEDDYWARIGFLTKDWRLSNLSKEDYELLRWWGDMASAAAQQGYTRSVAYCISQIAPTLELSQSKKGFLREMLNTIINRNTNITDEASKKSLLGMGKAKK